MNAIRTMFSTNLGSEYANISDLCRIDRGAVVNDHVGISGSMMDFKMPENKFPRAVNFISSWTPPKPLSKITILDAADAQVAAKIVLPYVMGQHSTKQMHNMIEGFPKDMILQFPLERYFMGTYPDGRAITLEGYLADVSVDIVRLAVAVVVFEVVHEKAGIAPRTHSTNYSTPGKAKQLDMDEMEQESPTASPSASKAAQKAGVTLNRIFTGQPVDDKIVNAKVRALLSRDLETLTGKTASELGFARDCMLAETCNGVGIIISKELRKIDLWQRASNMADVGDIHRLDITDLPDVYDCANRIAKLSCFRLAAVPETMACASAEMNKLLAKIYCKDSCRIAKRIFKTATASDPADGSPLGSALGVPTSSFGIMRKLSEGLITEAPSGLTLAKQIIDFETPKDADSIQDCTHAYLDLHAQVLRQERTNQGLASEWGTAVMQGIESCYFTFIKWLKKFLPTLTGGNITTFAADSAVVVENSKNSIIRVVRLGTEESLTLEKRAIQMLTTRISHLMTRYGVKFSKTQSQDPRQRPRHCYGKSWASDTESEDGPARPTRSTNRYGENLEKLRRDREGRRQEDEFKARRNPYRKARAPRDSAATRHVHSVVAKKRGRRGCPYCGSSKHGYTKNCPAKVWDIIHKQPGAHATDEYRQHQKEHGRSVARLSSRTTPLPDKMIAGITDQERERAIKKGKMPKTTEYMPDSDSEDESGAENDTVDKKVKKDHDKIAAAVRFNDPRAAEEYDSDGSESMDYSHGDSDYEYQSDATMSDEE